MGEKLVKYYEKAQKLGGDKAEFRLGILTCMPLIFAKDAEDTPDKIKKFDDAIKEIEKDYKKK